MHIEKARTPGKSSIREAIEDWFSALKEPGEFPSILKLREPPQPVCILTDNVYWARQELKKEGCDLKSPLDYTGTYPDGTPFKIFRDAHKPETARELRGQKFCGVRMFIMSRVADPDVIAMADRHVVKTQ